VLDKENIVPETNEFNNRKELLFSISAPDLIIQSVHWTPDVPSAGNRVTFDLVVKNQGNLTAGVTYVSYYIDQVFMGKHRIETMEPGAAVQMSFPWTAQKGDFQFTAFIDEDNAVNEKDESNNTKIIVLPAPDISVNMLTWCPGVPEEFTPITFTARIMNHGRAKSAVTALACSYDGAAPIFIETGEIGPGGTVSVVFTYAFVSGDHTLKLTADGYNAITENNETNNEITAGFNALSLSGTAVPISENVTAAKTTKTTIPAKTTTKTPSPLKTAPAVKASQAITSNITDSPPAWQTILQNKLLIIGVAAAGIGAIGVLLFLRMRAKKRQSQAE
jgi:subtilase family serine protease